jgi:hypothetical protein
LRPQQNHPLLIKLAGQTGYQLGEISARRAQYFLWGRLSICEGLAFQRRGRWDSSRKKQTAESLAAIADTKSSQTKIQP